MTGDNRSDLFFLPSWPPTPDVLLWVSLTIVVAGLLGEFVFRTLKLPRVIGYAAVGTAVSAFGPGIGGAALEPGLRLIVDLGLALLLFELGARINLRWLRANPWLLANSLAEAVLSFVAVYLTLVYLGTEARVAAAIASILVATSPAVVMRVASEFNASGQVTERMIVLTGLNTFYAVLASKFVVGWLHAEFAGSWFRSIAHPLYLLVGSAVVAALLAWCVSLIARRLDLRNENSALLLLGMILLALSLTKMANLSTLLVPLLAGLMLRNSTERPWIWPRHFGTAGGALVLLLFVITGSVWSVDALMTGAALGVAVILARLVAKTLATVVLGRPSGISMRQALALGFALMPISGAALVMMADLQTVYPEFAAQLTGIVFSAVAVLELLGPIAVQAALRYVNEDKIR
ncbi:MAG: sodium:proton exchanger [Comamonas sp. SCN 65-56]|uniref:cation:proton antiporter n=1 Tax=Comamonas sp. SCN 65-56 TaxID=1660095 RepID=UPI000869B7CD|nr:cation:proton antiporter [Comamonas sp. SCN 65-56]ODS88599.1 MAG: sodium:proton exchanger [Comamonas sp. SCN 65-56]